MTPDVWDYILWHDAAEIGTGDIPYPVKATHPELKAALEAIEAEVLDNLGVSMPHISEDLHKKIKMCELLEMAEFGADEMMMGNRYAQPILDDTLAALIVLARENDVWEQVTLYGRTVGLYNQEELQ
jgi:5'-deoxynucleotidase YfbR-like HD superfamily hydrolase